jgi:OOP family OmpA-OmpF porin
MFDSNGHKILIGVVAGALLSTTVTTGMAATDKTTHHLIDSQGRPVTTNRPDECVQTPLTPNLSSRLFKLCGDVLDRDGDGIDDDEDQCPDNTPEEIEKGVYQSGQNKGCPIDSDNDGIPDYRDDCPNNSREEISKNVDNRGCPLDLDQDGVPDYQDLCIGTQYGVKVDQHGCAMVIKTPEVIVLAGDVTFAYNKAELTPQAMTTLDELVNQIEVNFVKNIEIVGHTDSMGSEEYNQKLSEKRADSVASYLEVKGIPYDKIQKWGDGESNPISPNDTKIGRAKNRRVELTITRFEKK